MESVLSSPRRFLAARLILGSGLFFCSLVFAAAPDTDNDGVPDKLDKCPGSATMPSVSPEFKYKHAISKERLLPGSKSWPVDEHTTVTMTGSSTARTIVLMTARRRSPWVWQKTAVRSTAILTVHRTIAINARTPPKALRPTNTGALNKMPFKDLALV